MVAENGVRRLVTGLRWTLTGFIGVYRVSTGSMAYYRVVPGFSRFLAPSRSVRPKMAPRLSPKTKTAGLASVREMQYDDECVA